MTSTDNLHRRDDPTGQWHVGMKVRCTNPGRFKVLTENDIYTVDYLDWPFVLSVSEVPDMTWDLIRFKPYTGPIP
jgi:hypothetical protein